ncbi:MAG: hypothetical protein A3F40_00385 [Chlamydiae bacterium RIFCSPHIGHO2_12_FULL_27_8]|nr:MAG: hypothetical protein A3F40_00385 [Chlamydiae bacterium RIFCSPHIGHO2_12_FULL_27_8]OGN65375.1 MAG: hypothetical protein A2888_02985 [Chlamydiae bacterium RIFCSPLOWO2_01_FULL_28_7]
MTISSVFSVNSQGCPYLFLPLLDDIFKRDDGEELKRLLAQTQGNIDSFLMRYPTNPLFYSISFSAGNCLKKFIEAGANINIDDCNGNTLLLKAVESSTLEVISLLLRHGANPLFENQSNDSALSRAIEYGRNDIVQMFLEHLGNKDVYNSECETPLMLAILYNNYELIRLLILNQVNVNNTNNLDQTPLMYAVQSKNIEIIRLLVENGANPNSCNTNGYSPLLYALDSARLDIVELLLDSGAEADKSDYSFMAPLHYAIHLKQARLVKCLLEKGANIEKRIDFAKTPLMHAIINNDLESTKVLIEYKANVNAKDAYDTSALIYAIEKRNLDMVQLLFSNGAIFNLKDRFDRTTLFKAVSMKLSDISSLLIENVADVNNCIDESLQTLLHTASYTGDEVILKKLLSLGADMNATDILGRTPFELAPSEKIRSHLQETVVNTGRDTGHPRLFNFTSSYDFNGYFNYPNHINELSKLAQEFEFINTLRFNNLDEVCERLSKEKKGSIHLLILNVHGTERTFEFSDKESYEVKDAYVEEKLKRALEALSKYGALLLHSCNNGKKIAGKENMAEFFLRHLPKGARVLSPREEVSSIKVDSKTRFIYFFNRNKENVTSVIE